MPRVVVHKRAAKYLKRLQPTQQKKIKKLLKNLASDPTGVPGIEPMTGEWAGYRRIDLGNLRMIFWPDAEQDTLYVDHLGPRGDVYKSSP